MNRRPNDPFTSTTMPATLVDLLLWRALHQGEQRAYTFLVDGETETAYLTYGELDRQARAIAIQLQNMGAVGERALLVYPPGLEFIAAFFGSLYAGVVAVPIPPPRPNRPSPGFQATVIDAQARLVLTTASIQPQIKSRFTYTRELEALDWLYTDLVPSDTAGWQNPKVTVDTLAMLQYTSGSTSLPRGVMVSHGNLMYNQALITYGFQLDTSARGVFWLPGYHDMGLGSLLQSMYASFPAVWMSPASFIQHPVRWLEAITHYKGTISGAPNFAYDYCVETITSEQQSLLDLSSWRLAFCGAEPIRHQTLKRFAEKFRTCGFREQAFYPCYGLAEGTLLVTGGFGPTIPAVLRFDESALEDEQIVEVPPEHIIARALVGCGQALLDQHIVIADHKTATRCPPDRVGEIWVSSPSIAQGYWNRPEETRQTFQGYLADTGEGPFLHTGDQGFLYHGQLFITGRLKDLIIIRGRNYSPQDIEFIVEKSHPALQPRGVAAFSVDVADVRGEQLVIVHEVKRHHQHALDVAEVVRAIRKAVAEYFELQVYAVVLVEYLSISKTTSGKIQRRLCRNKFLDRSLKVVGEIIGFGRQLPQKEHT
jgi:acyl-CoA synthetase (AMP-forming)/AMP-acid ligase II